MSRMIVALALFFFLASLAQLAYLHVSIRQRPPVTLTAAPVALAADARFEDRLAAARFRSVTELEIDALARRYHQANVLLMARVWVTYLGFVTGMILSLVGAAFILGRLQEPVSELGAQAPQVSLTVKSASPGVILVGLGTLMMIVATLTNHRIEVSDNPLYLRGSVVETAPSGAVPPVLDNPYKKGN
jgi:hypothetical protein